MTGAFLEDTADSGLGFYIRRKSGYNCTSIGNTGKTRMTAIRKTKEDESEEMFKRHLKIAKKQVKKRIGLYEPLQFDTVFPQFLERLRTGDFSVLKNIPAGENIEIYLGNMAREFLIETAYFMLAESQVKRRVMGVLGITDENDIRVLEFVDFVTGQIETGDLKRLKTFGEKCKFKTFLSTVISRLLSDYWREHYKVKSNVTKFAPDFESIFDSPVDGPLTRLIKRDGEHLKKQASALLPGILDRLGDDERLAIKLKYEKNMKLSEIARCLEQSRYKAGVFIRETELEIKKELLSGLKGLKAVESDIGHKRRQG